MVAWGRCWWLRLCRFGGKRCSAMQKHHPPDLQSNDCRVITVAVSRSDMESVQVAINNTGTSCAYAPLKLDSGRHLRLRETQFGGADGCNYGSEAGENPNVVSCRHTSLLGCNQWSFVSRRTLTRERRSTLGRGRGE